MNQNAMFKLSYGLFVLSANADGFDNGCIINTAIQAASAPNQMSICVSKANYTHDMILTSRAFNISVLSNKADFEIFKHFGFQSGKEVDKFKDFKDAKRAENGILYITKSTNAYFSVQVNETMDLGSHTLFVGTITDMDVLSEDASLTYADYHAHVKPKPKAKEEKKGKVVWRCKICGWEVEAEELPADYICPLCKHPASDFEKIIV